MTKKSFILYYDLCAVFEELTDEQAGQLIKEITNYAHSKTKDNQKEPSRLFGLLNAVFTPFKNHIDRDFEAWESRAEIVRKNGQKGGRPKTEKTKTNQNEPVNVNVTVKDNVNDKDIKKNTKKNLRAKNYSDDFEFFWSQWKPYDMPKGDKQEASYYYENALKEVSNETIIRGAQAYCDECHRGRTKTKHAGRWLKKRGWENDPTHYAGKPADNRPGKTSFDTIVNAAYEPSAYDRMEGDY